MPSPKAHSPYVVFLYTWKGNGSAEHHSHFACGAALLRRQRRFFLAQNATIWRPPAAQGIIAQMPETPTASDLEKAHSILSEFGLLIGPAGEMSDVIARARFQVMWSSVEGR